MLTKIVAKKIMNSLSKYISIDMEKDFVVELWNGRLKMNKIEIRKQAAKNFKISGSIGNLDIKIPWSNIFSGFINVDVSDITIYISENTEVVHSQEILPESNLVVQEKKDGKMGFFERKILEKTLINIRNLKVKFKNYIFAIKNVILNEEKHLNMTDIESFTYHHTRKCKLLEKFSVNGKIIDNIVNIYTDCIKFNFFISNIQYHLSNFLPFRSFLVKDTNTSILTTGSNEKSEIKEFLDTESQNKIVDSDQKIKIRCAIDSIILNLYKDDNRLKTDHNNFKIHLSETFLDTTNEIKLVSKMESKHLSCDLLYDQTRFCAEKFYFNSSKFLKRLHNDFPVSSAIFLKKITFEKNILNLSHLILSLDKKKFKIPKAKLSLIKNVMSIKSIYDKTVHALKVHLLRRFFDFYQSLGIEPILKQFTSVQESPLQLAERFQIKISDVIIGNDFLFKNLEIAVFDILEESFKNEFDLKKLEVVNKEPKNNSDYKLNEKTETDILSIQDFSKTKIFVQKIIELSFDNASIFDNHYEHFRYSLNMNQLFPIEHINLNFIDIRNILENKDKERIFIESIKIPKCTIKGLSIDKDHLHIQNVNLIYDIDLVNSIYTIKTIIYSALGHKSKDTIAQKKEKVDFSIFLDNLTYFHRMLIEVSKLSFKNEILVLKCKSEGVEVDVKCDFSIENKNVITINITGYTDPEQYRLLIMTLVEFVSVLKEILDDPFEEKTPSNPLIFSTNCDLKIRDVVCNIQQHCNHGFYWFKTQVDTVIHGSEIKVTAKEAILEKLLFIEKQASHNFSEKGEPEVYDQLSKFFCQNEKSYVSTGNIAKVESVQCLIYDIPFGFNVSVHIPFLESTFGVHDFLVLKEKIITPKFDLIGTATNLYFKVQIDEIEAGNIHPELKKVKIIDFHLIQNKIKFDVTFDNISTIVVIKTDIGIANTVAISSNNIIIAKHLDFIDKYRNIVEFLIEEANTEFTPVKATQYNFVLKDTEIFLKRDPPIGQDILSEDVPFLRITIEKMIFFVPGTSSIKFYVDIFNPRRLGFDILIEPSTIIVTKHGEKFGILAETFNLSIQKETFKTFSIDPQEYLLYIENLMRDLSVFSKLKPIKYFEVNQNGTGSIFLQDTTANQSMFSEGTSSSQPAPFKPDDLSKIPGTQNVEIAPLCAVVSTKNTFSHRHTFSINGHPITLDMTQNSRIFFENSFIFMQIQNFTRNICFYKHIFFKNCLPYDLKLFIGNEDFQDEEIDLREECSFNTEFRFLRIGWREKRSADCFEFQKGIFKTHDNSDRQDAIKSLFKSKYDIMEKFILLAEKSIQINDRIINISSYVENVQGHFLYYVFFTPHSFIVNQTAKTHNIKLKNDYIEKTFSLDPEEIIVNDCFSLKNDLFLLRPSIGIKKNTSFEYRSSPQQTLDIEGSRAASNDDPIDFIISKEREKNVPDLQFSEKKLQIEIRGNAFPIVRVFVICPQFKINNLIDQNVTIDKVKIPKGTFEMPIDYGVVSIDSKTKIFDFNVLNILKEIDHKYIFSMEKEEISIDMGQKLNIVDVLNLTNPSNITYTQNIIEIDYSFLVRNETDIDLTVNGVSIGSSEEKFIAMKNKNVLKIGQQHIHLIKSPCFKHQDSFYTIITYIAKRRKIMRLCVSQAPIMIFNNLESIVCVNKKYFIQPFANLPFVHEDYEEFDIQFEFNHENKIRKIKRQLGRSFEIDGIQISSTQRGMREYIHVGKNNQNLSYTETLNFKIRKTIISLFEEEKEFLNIYVRDLNFCRKEDNLSKNCKIEMTVKGFQIDNQEHSPFFPIVLNPVFSQFYYYNTKSIENQYFIAFSCEFDPKLLASSRTNQKPEYSIIKDQESFNDINQKNVNENSKDQIKDQESFNDINQKNVNENLKDQIKDVSENSKDQIKDVNENSKDQIKDVNENSKNQIKDVNENSKDQIKDVNENSKDQIKDVNENSKDQIKEVNNFTAALNSIHLNKFDNQIIQSDDVEKSEKIIDFMFFTIHEFEINLEDEVITRLVDWIPKKKEESLLLFYLLHIGPIKMRLSLNMSKKKKILERMASFFVSNLSEVRLSFKSLIFTQFGFNTELIINAYKMQILSQIFRIIGGLDFLGNISSLVEELSFGVHDLFNEPYNGFKQDDLLLFTTGILKGGKNFTTYFLKGITNTVSKIGKSISKSSSKRVILFYEPLEVDVSKDFLENVVDGISGIITKPVQGAKKKGIKGFFKGIGSGITGALSKPIAGVSEIAANINEDLKFTLEGIELKRIRYPRPRLEIFSLERCQAYYLFQIFKYKHLQPIRPVSTRTSIKDEEFIDGEIGTILDVRVHLILTTKRLVLISREANIHINEFIFVSNGVKAEQWIIHTSREFLSRIKDNFFNLSAQEDNHISLDQ